MIGVFKQIALQWWRKKTCRHNKGILALGLEGFSVIEVKTFGVTMGWDLRPHVSKQSVFRCHICGEKFLGVRGYYPHDKETPRNEMDWPLNPDGSKMEIEA